MTPDDVKARVSDAYNAASDFYDDPSNSFWHRFGRRTVERLELSPGMRVLDVCCGSGASALEAAENVGPTGSVLGVDIAEGLLALARAKAAARGLGNATFRYGDLLDLGLDEASYDAVICVFGVFFVPDMEDAVRRLWRYVAPGGRLAITSWGAGSFEPANSVFWNAVRSIRPDLYKGFNPWDRIADTAALRTMLEAAGLDDVEVELERSDHPVERADDWWKVVLGSGYRATVDALDPEMREHLRCANLELLATRAIAALDMNVLYGIARKDVR
jgi:ubiquinone/menaquinone biosynthesis C-methylase UbiE